MQAKKSLLFNDNTTWSKKTSKLLLDVTIGRFEAVAETCELVGSYLLSKLTPEYSKDNGLYFFICVRLELFYDFLQFDWLHEWAAFYDILARGPKELFF